MTKEVPVHPRKAVALEALSLEVTARKSRLEQEREIAKRLNLRYLHINANASGKGGCTIAYKTPARKGGKIIPVSIALCHVNDSFQKREGRFLAAQYFDKGNVIWLRVPKNYSIPEFLESTFWLTATGVKW